MSHFDKTTSRTKAMLQRPPDNLYAMLMEMTLNYTIESPGNFFGYAVQYFKNVRDIQEAIKLAEASEPSISTELISTVPDEDLSLPSQLVRHRTVRGETYDIRPRYPVEENVIPKTSEIRALILRSLRLSVLFRTLNRELMSKVINAMQKVELESGQNLMQQGEVTEAFYVVENGKLDAVITSPGEEPRLLKTYERGSIFGELALLHIVGSGASIQAVTDATLWTIERSTYRNMMIRASIKQRDTRRRLVSSVDMLRNLTKQEVHRLADALKPKVYSKGAWLYRIGDASDGMYFLEKGLVFLTRTSDMGKQVVTSRRGRHQYFGEKALVCSTPRQESAIAFLNVTVLFLDVEDLESVVGHGLSILRRTKQDFSEMMLKIFGSVDQIKDLRDPQKKVRVRQRKDKLKRVMRKNDFKNLFHKITGHAKF